MFWNRTAGCDLSAYVGLDDLFRKLLRIAPCQRPHDIMPAQDDALVLVGNDFCPGVVLLPTPTGANTSVCTRAIQCTLPVGAG